jgi:D-alanyl-D-alanine carboxypeptidase
MKISKRLRTFLSVLFLASTLATGNAQAPPVDPALAAALQQKLESLVTTFNVPGIACTIILPGDQTWQGAAGMNHIYNFTSMDTNRVFQLASVTKMFVAAVVMDLVGEGQIALDDSLGTYLAPLPNINGAVTIRNLLRHRSGIHNWLENPVAANTWFNAPDSIWTPENVISAYVLAPTGSTAFQYSNTNYLLLGMIVEAVTGNTFAAELRSRFLDPDGLDQIFLPPFDTVTGPLATGWTSFTQPNGFDTDASPIFNDCYASMVWTAGAMMGQTEDVARFTRLLHSGQLIHDTLVAQMQQITSSGPIGSGNGYGLGTIRFNFNLRNYFGHAGDISGFTQLAMHREQDGVTLALAVNRGLAPRGPMATELLKVVNNYLAATGTSEAAGRPEVLTIRPNPASGEAWISGNSVGGGKFQLDIVDASGRRVREATFENQAPGAFELPVSLAGLAPGWYACRLTGPEASGLKYLLVQSSGF